MRRMAITAAAAVLMLGLAGPADAEFTRIDLRIFGMD